MADSALKLKIIEDMKQAMRDQAKEKLQVIRLITAALKQKEVDERIELQDTDVLVILDKMIKQRRESVKQYEQVNRPELAAQENFEIEIIQVYLPKALDEAELDQIIKSAVAETGAKGMQDMSKVMAILKPKIQGRADMGLVSQKIKAALSAQ